MTVPGKRPAYWPRATRALGAADPVMAGLIRQYRGLTLASRGDAFQTLARSIVGQQISVKAAQSVWDRFVAEVGVMEPARVLRKSAERLRGCGLSGQKLNYLRDLSARFAGGAIDVSRWHAMDDEALIDELTEVKGIGRWTAEMFLIFYLTRPDVFPLADIGLQRAMELHYNRGRRLSERRIITLGRLWSPWRSVATWYLWRSLDPIPVEY
ncbi:MAG: DNA-3-methyladenine glycosylase 2 family protein [Betaproteobacteria bacterium]|nr:DNA-3-methyladenine glycosylase 2 family protein [Betaproteobacteria bacterium]